MLQSFWDHPLYTDDMWLNVIWNEDDSIADIEIGVGGVLVDH
jgi:hypothetical protein